MGSEKIVINDGVFLGMLAEDKNKKINYWNSFVHIGSANGFFKGLLTNSALLLNIHDQYNNAPLNTTCIVYTQSLNIRNLHNFIQLIAQNSLQNYTSDVPNMGLSLLTGGNNYNKLHKYHNKLNII